MNRTHYTTWDSVRHLWSNLGLPQRALERLRLGGGDDVASPSSFKIGHLAQSTVAVSGLLASLIHANRTGSSTTSLVAVDRRHAIVEFQSEKLYRLDLQPSRLPWGTIGGLHKTGVGYVRVHDSFPNHRQAALKLVGCSPDATREQVSQKMKAKRAKDLEDAAVDAGAVMFALRSFDEWNSTPQAQAVPDFPITITKVVETALNSRHRDFNRLQKCLSGIRVLEMSRVIAAPVAGKTLAVHGADVVWVTSPNLPDLPELDKDLSRGKRTVQLDINDPADKEKLLRLLDEADVLLQSYRPGSLAGKGLDMQTLLLRDRKRPLICANLTAWGTDGPWATRRGFDSIVQTATGTNTSEAEYFGAGQAARPLPCQALDHGSGYLLASGIMAALYRQAVEGGCYQVDVSLAGVMKYLRSLGQYEDKVCFECKGYEEFEDVPLDLFEIRESAFGQLQAIRHSVHIEGVDVGWDHMPKPLGSDQPEWLPD